MKKFASIDILTEEGWKQALELVEEILASYPTAVGDTSARTGSYYANSRNQFWIVLSSCCRIPVVEWNAMSAAP